MIFTGNLKVLMGEQSNSRTEMPPDCSQLMGSGRAEMGRSGPALPPHPGVCFGRSRGMGTGRFSHQGGGEGGEVALKPPQGTDLDETGELLLALCLA